MHSSIVQLLEKAQFEGVHVQWIKAEEPGCRLRAKAAALEKAVEEIKRRADEVVHEEHSVDAAMADFFELEKTRALVHAIGHQHNVVIQYMDGCVRSPSGE